MTGKGDRWDRDSVGRSAPAFLAASTTAPPPPPPTCTARREAGQLCGSCCFAARPANCGPFVSLRPVPGGESAGCVCLQCLVQQAVCLSTLCHVMPTALHMFLPPFKSTLPCPVILFACPCSFHVRQDQPFEPTVCKLQDCPVGSCNTGLQWRPVHRFLTFPPFPAESMILGHGCSVKIIRLRCTVL